MLANLKPSSLYHGTTPTVVNQLATGNINVALGGGEFGRGFYMGTSKRLARRRAFHKTFSKKGTAQEAMCILGNTLQIDIINSTLRFAYHCRLLCLTGALGLYGSLKKTGQTNSYTDSNDVLMGPVVGNSRYYQVVQYKFQTHRIQTTLNSGGNNRIISNVAVI